jgi:plasmid maintenance system antidote protein VapI
MPVKNPPHPGAFIRAEIIAPAGLSVTAAIAALQIRFERNTIKYY